MLALQMTPIPRGIQDWYIGGLTGCINDHAFIIIMINNLLKYDAPNRELQYNIS